MVIEVVCLNLVVLGNQSVKAYINQLLTLIVLIFKSPQDIGENGREIRLLGVLIRRISDQIL